MYTLSSHEFALWDWTRPLVKSRTIHGSAAAATAGKKDAATSGEDLIAAAATAGPKDAATPLEQQSEDPEHVGIRHELLNQEARRRDVCGEPDCRCRNSWLE